MNEVLDYFMRKAVYLCLITVALAGTALAQSITTTQAQQEDKVVVGANLVTLNVIVTDSKGRYVKGLSRDQFDIYDNKVKQQIAHFSSDASPVSIGIVYEVHETATEKTRAMLAAIKQFTSTLKNEDDFFFLAFSERGKFFNRFCSFGESGSGSSSVRETERSIFALRLDLSRCGSITNVTQSQEGVTRDFGWAGHQQHSQSRQATESPENT